MNLKLDELKKHARNIEAFDTTEVRETLERLAAEEVEELCSDSEFFGKLTHDIQELQKDLNQRFVGREDMIEMALACGVAYLPMLALGPPGTAKSNVFRRLSYGLGLRSNPLSIQELSERMKQIEAAIPKNGAPPVAPAAGSPGDNTGSATAPRGSAAARNGSSRSKRGYFEYLLTRHTTPEEILGPANLELMIKCALFYRQTTGLLPEAEVTFVDEVFKANSAILNALLSIFQERLFYNAGEPVRVPLCMIYGASNEPPREEELGAFYDRFPIRVLCLPVTDSFESTRKLLQKAMKQAHDGLFAESDDGKAAGDRVLATVNHFRFLHRAMHVRFGGESVGESGDEFLRAYCDTFNCLKREFQISDRSAFFLYRAARALAIVRGHDSLKPSELDVFKFTFRDAESAAALGDAVDERKRRYDSFRPSRRLVRS